MLPSNLDVAYSVICEQPGMVFVDKSTFVSPRYPQPQHCVLPLLRRPRGFGKTTFLSILEEYVDLYHLSHELEVYELKSLLISLIYDEILE